MYFFFFLSLTHLYTVCLTARVRKSCHGTKDKKSAAPFIQCSVYFWLSFRFPSSNIFSTLCFPFFSFVQYFLYFMIYFLSLHPIFSRLLGLFYFPSFSIFSASCFLNLLSLHPIFSLIASLFLPSSNIPILLVAFSFIFIFISFPFFFFLHPIFSVLLASLPVYISPSHLSLCDNIIRQWEKKKKRKKFMTAWDWLLHPHSYRSTHVLFFYSFLFFFRFSPPLTPQCRKMKK